MLSFHVTFVQMDRQTDRRTTVKQYAPDLSIRVHKNAYVPPDTSAYPSKTLHPNFE